MFIIFMIKISPVVYSLFVIWEILLEIEWPKKYIIKKWDELKNWYCCETDYIQECWLLISIFEWELYFEGDSDKYLFVDFIKYFLGVLCSICDLYKHLCIHIHFSRINKIIKNAFLFHDILNGFCGYCFMYIESQLNFSFVPFNVNVFFTSFYWNYL